MQCSVPASGFYKWNCQPFPWYNCTIVLTTIQVFPIWSQIAQFITESPKGILALTKSWLKIIQETWQVNLLLRASLQKQFLCSDCFHRGLVLAAAVFAHGINMSLRWAAKKMATVFSKCISQLYLSAVLAQCRLFAHGINMSLCGVATVARIMAKIAKLGNPFPTIWV